MLIEGVNPIGAAFVTVFVLTLLIDVLVAAAPLSASPRRGFTRREDKKGNKQAEGMPRTRHPLCFGL